MALTFRLTVGRFVLCDVVLFDIAENEPDESTTQLGGGTGTVLEAESFEPDFVTGFCRSGQTRNTRQYVP